MILSFKLSDLKPLSSYDQFMHKVVCILSHCSHVRLFVTPWTVARQAPLSMAFSRQEYWSVLPLAASGYLPDPGIKPTSLASDGLFEGLTHWKRL